MHNNAIQNGDSYLALPQAESSLQDILHIALRHRWTILLTTVGFLLAAFIYLLNATPIYKSESRLYVEQIGPRILNEYEGVMTRSGNYLYTQAELLMSTPVLGDIFDDPNDPNAPNIARFKTFADVDNLVGFVRANMNVGVGRKDDIITVSFESPYPLEAAQIVRETVDSYIRYHSETKRTTAAEVLNILWTERKDNLIPELDRAYDDMNDFTAEHGIVSFDNKGGHIVFERLRALSNELSQAEMAALTAKADFEAVESMENDAFKIRQFAAASTGSSVRVSVADKETQLQSELRQAEMGLKDALHHGTENHPSIQAIRAKIDRINQELKKEAKEFANAYVEVMRLRYVTAREREADVNESFLAQLDEAKSLGSLVTEYSRLNSRLIRAERACETIDNRIKELNVNATQDMGALNISILEFAKAADNPSKPQRARIMTMALALGLMFGAGLAFLRDWLDFRLRSSEEVSAILGIPVLGVVPKMLTNKATAILGHKVLAPLKPVAARSKSLRTQDGTSAMTETQDAVERGQKIPLELESVRWIQRVSKKANGSAHTATVRRVSRDKPKTPAADTPAARKGETATSKPEILVRGQKVHLESKSVVAEAYRTIRTAVFFGAPREDAKAIHITSPAPGDGKSTLVSNLAITMAQAGQRTLVIDADFRKPVQHKIFEVDDDKGLSSVLAGRDTIEQAIRPGVIDGLYIMACGPEVPNPSELLNSDVFNETLKKLTEQYDRVIVDSPPVAPVADAQILAAVCDITLLVLRAEKSTRRQAQHARDSLLGVGAKLLGAVVNDVQQKRGYYSSYGDYGNYGYYSKREKKTG